MYDKNITKGLFLLINKIIDKIKRNNKLFKFEIKQI